MTQNMCAFYISMSADPLGSTLRQAQSVITHNKSAAAITTLCKDSIRRANDMISELDAYATIVASMQSEVATGTVVVASLDGETETSTTDTEKLSSETVWGVGVLDSDSKLTNTEKQLVRDHLTKAQPDPVETGDVEGFLGERDRALGSGSETEVVSAQRKYLILRAAEEMTAHGVIKNSLKSAGSNDDARLEGFTGTTASPNQNFKSEADIREMKLDINRLKDVFDEAKANALKTYSTPADTVNSFFGLTPAIQAKLKQVTSGKTTATGALSDLSSKVGDAFKHARTTAIGLLDENSLVPQDSKDALKAKAFTDLGARDQAASVKQMLQDLESSKRREGRLARSKLDMARAIQQALTGSGSTDMSRSLEPLDSFNVRSITLNANDFPSSSSVKTDLTTYPGNLNPSDTVAGTAANCRGKLMSASKRMISDVAHNESSESAGDLLLVLDEADYTDDWYNASAVVRAIESEALARSGEKTLDELREATDLALTAHKQAIALSDNLSKGIGLLTPTSIADALRDTRDRMRAHMGAYDDPKEYIENVRKTDGSLNDLDKKWIALDEFQTKFTTRTETIKTMIPLRRELEAKLSSDPSSGYQLEHLIELDDQAINGIGSGLPSFDEYAAWEAHYSNLVTLDASLLVLGREIKYRSGHVWSTALKDLWTTRESTATNQTAKLADIDEQIGNEMLRIGLIECRDRAAYRVQSAVLEVNALSPGSITVGADGVPAVTEAKMPDYGVRTMKEKEVDLNDIGITGSSISDETMLIGKLDETDQAGDIKIRQYLLAKRATEWHTAHKAVELIEAIMAVRDRRVVVAGLLQARLNELLEAAKDNLTKAAAQEPSLVNARDAALAALSGFSAASLSGKGTTEADTLTAHTDDDVKGYAQELHNLTKGETAIREQKEKYKRKSVSSAVAALEVATTALTEADHEVTTRSKALALEVSKTTASNNENVSALDVNAYLAAQRIARPSGLWEKANLGTSAPLKESDYPDDDVRKSAARTLNTAYRALNSAVDNRNAKWRTYDHALADLSNARGIQLGLTITIAQDYASVRSAASSEETTILNEESKRDRDLVSEAERLCKSHKKDQLTSQSGVAAVVDLTGIKTHYTTKGSSQAVGYSYANDVGTGFTGAKYASRLHSLLRTVDADLRQSDETKRIIPTSGRQACKKAFKHMMLIVDQLKTAKGRDDESNSSFNKYRALLLSVKAAGLVEDSATHSQIDSQLSSLDRTNAAVDKALGSTDRTMWQQNQTLISDLEGEVDLSSKFGLVLERLYVLAKQEADLEADQLKAQEKDYVYWSGLTTQQRLTNLEAFLDFNDDYLFKTKRDKDSTLEDRVTNWLGGANSNVVSDSGGLPEAPVSRASGSLNSLNADYLSFRGGLMSDPKRREFSELTDALEAHKTALNGLITTENNSINNATNKDLVSVSWDLTIPVATDAGSTSGSRLTRSTTKLFVRPLKVGAGSLFGSTRWQTPTAVHYKRLSAHALVDALSLVSIEGAHVILRAGVEIPDDVEYLKFDFNSCVYKVALSGTAVTMNLKTNLYWGNDGNSTLVDFYNEKNTVKGTIDTQYIATRASGEVVAAKRCLEEMIVASLEGINRKTNNNVIVDDATITDENTVPPLDQHYPLDNENYSTKDGELIKLGNAIGNVFERLAAAKTRYNQARTTASSAYTNAIEGRKVINSKRALIRSLEELRMDTVIRFTRYDSPLNALKTTLKSDLETEEATYNRDFLQTWTTESNAIKTERDKIDELKDIHTWAITNITTPAGTKTRLQRLQNASARSRDATTGIASLTALVDKCERRYKDVESNSAVVRSALDFRRSDAAVENGVHYNDSELVEELIKNANKDRFGTKLNYRNSEGSVVEITGDPLQTLTEHSTSACKAIHGSYLGYVGALEAIYARASRERGRRAYVKNTADTLLLEVKNAITAASPAFSAAESSLTDYENGLSSEPSKDTPKAALEPGSVLGSFISRGDTVILQKVGDDGTTITHQSTPVFPSEEFNSAVLALADKTNLSDLSPELKSVLTANLTNSVLTITMARNLHDELEKLGITAKAAEGTTHQWSAKDFVAIKVTSSPARVFPNPAISPYAGVRVNSGEYYAVLKEALSTAGVAVGTSFNSLTSSSYFKPLGLPAGGLTTANKTYLDELLENTPNVVLVNADNHVRSRTATDSSILSDGDDAHVSARYNDYLADVLDVTQPEISDRLTSATRRLTPSVPSSSVDWEKSPRLFEKENRDFTDRFLRLKVRRIQSYSFWLIKALDEVIAKVLSNTATLNSGDSSTFEARDLSEAVLSGNNAIATDFETKRTDYNALDDAIVKVENSYILPADVVTNANSTTESDLQTKAKNLQLAHGAAALDSIDVLKAEAANASSIADGEGNGDYGTAGTVGWMKSLGQAIRVSGINVIRNTDTTLGDLKTLRAKLYDINTGAVAGFTKDNQGYTSFAWAGIGSGVENDAYSQLLAKLQALHNSTSNPRTSRLIAREIPVQLFASKPSEVKEISLLDEEYLADFSNSLRNGVKEVDKMKNRIAALKAAHATKTTDWVDSGGTRSFLPTFPNLKSTGETIIKIDNYDFPISQYKADQGLKFYSDLALHLGHSLGPSAPTDASAAYDTLSKKVYQDESRIVRPASNLTLRLAQGLLAQELAHKGKGTMKDAGNGFKDLRDTWVPLAGVSTDSEIRSDQWMGTDAEFNMWAISGEDKLTVGDLEARSTVIDEWPIPRDWLSSTNVVSYHDTATLKYNELTTLSATSGGSVYKILNSNLSGLETDTSGANTAITDALTGVKQRAEDLSEALDERGRLSDRSTELKKATSDFLENIRRKLSSSLTVTFESSDGTHSDIPIPIPTFLEGTYDRPKGFSKAKAAKSGGLGLTGDDKTLYDNLFKDRIDDIVDKQRKAHYDLRTNAASINQSTILLTGDAASSISDAKQKIDQGTGTFPTSVIKKYHDIIRRSNQSRTSMSDSSVLATASDLDLIDSAVALTGKVFSTFTGDTSEQVIKFATQMIESGQASPLDIYMRFAANGIKGVTSFLRHNPGTVVLTPGQLAGLDPANLAKIFNAIKDLNTAQVTDKSKVPISALNGTMGTRSWGYARFRSLIPRLTDVKFMGNEFTGDNTSKAAGVLARMPILGNVGLTEAEWGSVIAPADTWSDWESKATERSVVFGANAGLTKDGNTAYGSLHKVSQHQLLAAMMQGTVPKLIERGSSMKLELGLAQYSDGELKLDIKGASENAKLTIQKAGGIPSDRSVTSSGSYTLSASNEVIRYKVTDEVGAVKEDTGWLFLSVQ